MVYLGVLISDIHTQKKKNHGGSDFYLCNKYNNCFDKVQTLSSSVLKTFSFCGFVATGTPRSLKIGAVIYSVLIPGTVLYI